MNKPLTIEDLYRECKKQIDKGNGKKVIMISDDDEGNGFHYLWYSFCNADEVILNDYEIDERVAKMEDTITLG